jgi:hypothetical protein
MSDTPAGISASPPPEPSGLLRKPITLFLAAIVLAAAVYLVFFHSPAPAPAPATSRLPFGPAEQAYAAQLKVGNLAMSQAENFLNQEVKILSGDILNSGDRPLKGIEATITFQDEMQQIALREVRPLFLQAATPLEPGKTAHFDISFDHVPPSWNMQMPSLRISGMEFARQR